MKISHLIFIFCYGFSISECFQWNQIETKTDKADLEGYVSISEYPYVVSIIAVHSYGHITKDEFICGGTIVRHAGAKFNQFQIMILTAGSCIKHLETLKLSPRDVRVRGNTEYWGNCSCGVSVELIVRKWKKHPRFNQIGSRVDSLLKFSHYDVGLVVAHGIRAPYYVNSVILRQPVKIENADDNPESKIDAFGWGFSKGQARIKNELRKLTPLTIILREDCKKYYKGQNLPEHTYCVWNNVTPHAVPCLYDQGGPLIQKKAAHGALGTKLLIGIISRNYKCADPRYPPIITNPLDFKQFIYNKDWF